MSVSSVSAASNFYQSRVATASQTAAAALVALRTNPRAKVTIRDTADEITRNFEALSRVASNVTTITVSDAGDDPPGTVSLTSAQYLAQATRLLTKFAAGSGFEVSRMAASRAAGLQSDSRVRSFSVMDNSTEIATRLSNLQGMAKLSTVEVSTPQTLITMTASLYDTLSQADDSVLDRITTGSAGLALTAATAEQAVAVKDVTRVRSVNVLDSAASIVDQMDQLRELGARLKGVRARTNTGADADLSLTVDKVQRNALVIGKLYQGCDLAVTGANVSQVAALAANRRVIAIDVQDTAANVAANIDQLAKLGSDLGTIHLTDAQNPLALSSRQFMARSAVLDQIDSDYTVTLSGASVLEAQTLVSDTRVASLAVVDSAAAISRSLAALQNMGDSLTGISLTGRIQPLQISASALADATVLTKVSGPYTLSVSGATAAGAMSLIADGRVTSISVADDGASILGQLDGLARYGKRLNTIRLTNAQSPLQLTALRWSQHMGTLAKIEGGYGVALTGVSAARASTLVADSRVRTLAVTDTTAAISARLDELHDLGAALVSIDRTDAAALSVTGQQYTTQATTLAKMGDGLTLSIRQASAELAASLGDDADNVVSVDVVDTVANISSRLDGLQDAIDGNGDRTWSIRASGAPAAMALTSASYLRNTQALAAVASPQALILNSVAADEIDSVASDRRVVGLSVTASASELSDPASLDKLSALGSRLLRVTQSDPSQALSLTATQWKQYRPTLDKTAGGFRVDLSEVTASEVTSLGADWRVRSVAVADTGGEISAAWESLRVAGPLVSSIEQLDDQDIALTMTQLRNGAAVAAKLGADSHLAISGATVADAAQLNGDDYAAVTSVSVLDTAATVASAMGDLAGNAKVTAISLSNPGVPMAMSRAQMVDNADGLAKLQGSWSVEVSAVDVADVASLLDDANLTDHLASLSVSGTASDITDHLADLTRAGRRLSSVTMTDSNPLQLTQTQWLTHQAALSKIRSPWSAQLGGVSASQAATLASSARVSQVTVSDTGANIARNLDGLQAMGGRLSSITTTDDSTPTLAIRADQAFAAVSTLAKIADGRYNLSVSGATTDEALRLSGNNKVLTMTVADGSAAIATRFDSLAALGSRITAITQTGSREALRLSAQAYATQTATLAKIQNNYTVRLSDATVAAAAGLQADVKVVGFTVRGTTSQIGAALGSLSGMDKLTGLGLSADDGLISVAEASLGAVGTGLNLLQQATGGVRYRLHVTDVSMGTVESIAARDDVYSFAVRTTSQTLADDIGALQPLNDRLSAITLSDVTEPVALTHEQWLTHSAVVNKIQGNYQIALLDVSAGAAVSAAALAHVSSVSVLDTASAISEQFDVLSAMGSALDQVEVRDAGDVRITTAQSESANGAALIDKIVGEHEIVITDPPEA